MKLFETLTGALGLVGALFVIALAIFWLLFPWMVVSRLDRIVKSVEETEKVAKANELVTRNFFSDIRDWMKSETRR